MREVELEAACADLREALAHFDPNHPALQKNAGKSFLERMHKYRRAAMAIQVMWVDQALVVDHKTMGELREALAALASIKV